MPHVDLLELPYFQGIVIDELVSLVDLMTPHRFEAGAVIVEEGAPNPPPLYIATTGAVKISKKTPEGHARALAQLASPTLFGEIELFCQIPAVATAVAVNTVDAFALTRPVFERLFEARHPALLQFTCNVTQVACHRLAIADEMMAEMVGGDDLVPLRQTIFARMHQNSAWPSTTGAFRRPKCK